MRTGSPGSGSAPPELIGEAFLSILDGYAAPRPTDEANGCLLCGYHHRLIHTGDWQVIIGADQHPYVIPRDWIDPTRTPLRNTYWHPDWHPQPQPGRRATRQRHSHRSRQTPR